MTAHRILQDLYYSPLNIPDPGDTKTINVSKNGAICSLVTTGTQTRTLAQPSKAGIHCTLCLATDGGDCTLTVTGGYNQDGSTSIVFGDAGDFVNFVSIKVGSSFYWRVLKADGVNVVEGRDLMAPSSVIAALIEQYDSKVYRVGNFIKTEILIDLTGAKSTTTDKDIIGNTGVCHFGQITTAINGAIRCGQVTCLEVPAGGADDIDFYMASVGTGAYDADGSALTNAASLITKGGAWALGSPGAATAMTAAITADYYLYLLSGEAGTAATYTAGKFLIELWGEG